MHDLDRIRSESANGMADDDFEMESADFEWQGEDEFEWGGDGELAGEFEWEQGGSGTGNPFDEATELELAAELLEIQSEAELEQFLGKIGDFAKRAAGAVKRGLDSSVGRQVTGALKDVARKALPIAGGAIGGALGGSTGRTIGSKLGGFASGLFEMELEGLSPEDQEFEIARRFVRMAGTATQAAARRSGAGSPQAAARVALMVAAKRHAPGLVDVLRQRRGSGGSEGANGPFDEATELELATELLEIQSEGELEQFLGDLFNKAVTTVRDFASSDTGRRVGSTLKNVAKTALPIAGGAIGGAVGRKLGGLAGGLFEMEFDGAGDEDPTFESARRFVRVAGTAAQSAARRGRVNPPEAAARAGLMVAARRHAPGLVGALRRNGKGGIGEGADRPFDDSTEMELAAELLEIQGEAELEQFLGGVIKKAVSGVRDFAKSSAGKTVGKVLTGVAKKALPIAGGAVGTFFGGPAGGAIGSQIGGFASNLFEMEMEAMDPEDRDFEVARRFVRLAGTAAQTTARRARMAPAQAAARAGLMTAARRHAPGVVRLLRDDESVMVPRVAGEGRTGRWIRQNDRIVLMGA